MKKPSRRNRHKSLQARAVDEAVGAEAGGAEIAGPLWEYVPRAWAAVSRDIEFRDTWESCERVLQVVGPVRRGGAYEGGGFSESVFETNVSSARTARAQVRGNA